MGRDRLLHPIAVFVFFALLATALLAPIASETLIPNLGDYFIHLSGIIQAKFGLMEGQFPLRVMPLEFEGFRYPYYQFNSPTSYTLAGLIYWLITPDNPLMAFKMTIWLVIVIGGIYLYRLSYWLCQSKLVALLSGMVFLSSPYFIILVNHLASFSEITALSLTPVAIYYSLQRYYLPHKKSLLALTAISWYLLITTHIVTFMYSAFFVALLLGAMTIVNKRHWKNLISVGIAFGFGCLLAMWYLAPAIYFGKYLALSSTYTDPAHLVAYKPHLSELLSPAANLTVGMNNSAFTTIHPALGIPIVFAVLVAIYGYCCKGRSGSRRADLWLLPFLFIFTIAFLLVWSPINFWSWLPQPFLIAQHCWRLLAQVIWIGAILFAWSICYVLHHQLDKRHFIATAAIILLSVSSWYPHMQFASIPLNDFIKNPHLIYNQEEFLINFNRYTQFVDQIDSVLLKPSDRLAFNHPYVLPKELIALADNPVVEIKGNLPSTFSPTTITAEVGKKAISSYQFKPVNFSWKIPLSHDLISSANIFTLIFKPPSSNSSMTILFDDMLLTGFVATHSILNVKQTVPLCHQQGVTTDCQIKISPAIKIIELPVIYYPQLLSIKINNQPVEYRSILREGQLLATVAPIASTNHIQIQFKGMAWANWVSVLSLVLLFASIVSRRRRRISVAQGPITGMNRRWC